MLQYNRPYCSLPITDHPIAASQSDLHSSPSQNRHVPRAAQASVLPGAPLTPWARPEGQLPSPIVWRQRYLVFVLGDVARTPLMMRVRVTGRWGEYGGSLEKKNPADHSYRYFSVSYYGNAPRFINQPVIFTSYLPTLGLKRCFFAHTCFSSFLHPSPHDGSHGRVVLVPQWLCPCACGSVRGR